MPQTEFICPDKEKIAIPSCLEKCRMWDRCLSLPTLTTLGESREWTGRASTTQCLNPTRMEYLKIKYPYAIDPFDRAFALLGTRHHGRLEAVAKQIEGIEAEKKLTGEVSGILDLLEPINGNNEYRLIDYKTFGSYAVAKHLKGTKIYDSGYADRLKLALQINNYRLMAQELGFNVTELKVQITVRDGNTKSAHINEVHNNLYLLPVDIMKDETVATYFKKKSDALKEAVEQDILPELCDEESRWNNRRCKGYCECVAYCEHGARLAKVEYLGVNNVDQTEEPDGDTPDIIPDGNQETSQE